uniref:Uncharacterized protein AlNc14C254G9692 n=1 Tax=Albugo laibachii Nc14 TaxID=890382 RepID=F0WTL5_9STRA|nr:conserved hypothetical protein [Albugo laibachii Nc14]|eukprot:CCA24706.1 conserved hypothetical protein [Albugo laibachii Nc14]
MDLYEGFELPKAENRPIVTKQFAPTSALLDPIADVPHSNSQSKRKRLTKDFDLDFSLLKLQRCMKSPSRFPKASELFCQLMDSHLNANTTSQFSACVHTFMTQDLVAKWSGSLALYKLTVRILKDKKSLHVDAGVAKNWTFAAITHYDLHTDDTYVFARATKVIRERAENITEKSFYQGEKCELELLMSLIKTLVKKHSILWAKTAVESVVSVATSKRAYFPEKQRQELDEWTACIQNRNNAADKQRYSSLRRNITEQHSMEFSQAKAVIGKSFHPLSNKQ